MPRSYNTPYTGPVGHVGLAERKRICEAVVGSVEWNEREGWGYCTCPGVQFHTGKNGRRDCRVYAEETPGASRTGGTLPPGVTCLHTSCASAIEEASKRIRSEIGRAKVAAGRAGAGSQPSGLAGARTPVSADKRASLAQPGKNRTGRTPSFKFSEGGQNRFRTGRTDISRPMRVYAQAGVHAHARGAGKCSEVASDASTGVAKVEQPKPQPAKPTAAAGGAAKVFCPVRLAWITREQWEQEQRDRPLQPSK